VPAAKFAKDIISKLLVSLLSAPIIWAITVYYSKSISEMVSSFDPIWYRHLWYLVLIAVVLGLLQQVILWTGEHTLRNVLVALLISLVLLGVYAWKQLAEREFPFDWPLWVSFFLYCIFVAQLVSLSLFGMIKITIIILAAADTPKSQ
jgi:hypothetical protein